MRCSVKSGNERNPCCQLRPRNGEHSGETARVKREEGADDVKSVWLLRPGLHTCYNGRYNETQYREVELIFKTGPSSDRSLQLDSVKSESLVKGHQLRPLEYVSRALYTPPVTSWKPAAPEVVDPTARRETPKVCLVTGMKS